jgi:molybdenum cofactor guanylyltransferase
MPSREEITGVILAGGRGTRMGQVDKGLQPFRGKSMAAHVIERLAPQVAWIAINANQNLDQYASFGVPVWPDDLQGFEGPMAGLETALRRCTTEYLVTAPCDSPFLPTDLVERLSAALDANGADLALAETEEPDDSGEMRVQPHPVFALVKKSALPHLASFLATGGRRMDGWYGAIKVVRVRFDDASAFRNINTMRELQQFESEQE